MRRVRRCPPTAHRWQIAWCLVMGLAWADGYYPVVLCRRCRLCGYGEVWAGEQNVDQQRLRLTSVAEG